MVFSVHYKISHRNEFLEKYFCKTFKNCVDEDVEISKDRLTDLMELMVNLILTENKAGLYDLLTKKNTKTARIFFNYLTCSNIRSINKEIIKERIEAIYKFQEGKYERFKRNFRRNGQFD